MFYNCTSLKSAPNLPATTLAEDCYKNMFTGCTNLTSVTMLAPSDQISEGHFADWLESAGIDAASRTLILKDAAAYNALSANNLANKYDYLTFNWRKDTPGNTVTVKDASNNPIE